MVNSTSCAGDFLLWEIGKYMANLSIPERYRYGVSKIRDLDMDTVRSFRSALDSAAFKDRPEVKVVAASAMESISQAGLPPGDFKKIGEALVSMYLVKSRRDTPLGEFVARVADAMQELPDSELRLAAGEQESFKEKLLILLGAEVFGVASKVDDLRTENERIFCHARIMTDLRPVFGSDVQKGPMAALVSHNLKIAYHESGRKGDHDIYVTLDTQDLNDLKEIILRAEAKAKTLRSMVDRKIELFGVSE